MQNRCFARRLIVRSGAERRFPAAATGKSTLFSRIALTFRIKKVIFADMELRVKQVREVTGPLLDAFARLMPQLSPRLEAPSGERLRADRGVPCGGALRRGGRRMRPGIAHPRVVRRAVGPQGVDRGCRGRCRSPRNGGGAVPRGRRTGTCGGCRGGRSPADLEPRAGGRAGALS